MTTYDPAAVEALLLAAKAVLDPEYDDEGRLLRVAWVRVRALRRAIAGIQGGPDALRNAAAVHCNCGGFFMPDGAWYVHADRCERPR